MLFFVLQGKDFSRSSGDSNSSSAGKRGSAAVLSAGAAAAGVRVIACDEDGSNNSNKYGVDESIYASSLKDASLLSQRAHIHLPRAKIETLLARRALQKNIGEQESFASYNSRSSNNAGSKEAEGNELSLGMVSSMVRDRIAMQPKHTPAIFVVDSSEDDFGSRANFGRGHDTKALAEGCLSSYDVFLKRLSNVAINRLNSQLAQSVCVLGSIDSTDLTAKVIN